LDIANLAQFRPISCDSSLDHIGPRNLPSARAMEDVQTNLPPIIEAIVHAALGSIPDPGEEEDAVEPHRELARFVTNIIRQTLFRIVPHYRAEISTSRFEMSRVVDPDLFGDSR
jgi:hypothetical protein